MKLYINFQTAPSPDLRRDRKRPSPGIRPGSSVTHSGRFVVERIASFVDKALGWLGVLFFLGCGVRWLSFYGTHWEFGRFGLPRAALIPGTTLYRDGTVPDPINLALIRSDSEEFAVAIMLGVLLILVVWCLRESYRLGCMVEKNRR